jgi:uncharacterized protein (DUF305 family)
MKKQLLQLTLLTALSGACLFSLNVGYAHDGGASEARETVGFMEMRMASVQKMMLSNLGKPDSDYDLRYMALLIAQEKAALKLSQEASQSALKPEVKQLALQQVAEHTARIEQLQNRTRQWFNL